MRYRFAHSSATVLQMSNKAGPFASPALNPNQKHCTFPIPLSALPLALLERDTTSFSQEHLVSVLDLDSLMSRDRAQMNEPAHRPSPTRENRHDTDVYLSERCQCAPSGRRKMKGGPFTRPTGRSNTYKMCLMIMLVSTLRRCRSAHGGATRQSTRTDWRSINPRLHHDEAHPCRAAQLLGMFC